MLYCSRFQAILTKLDKRKAEEHDIQIKTYIGSIRKKRDELYDSGYLPINDTGLVNGEAKI